MFKYSNETTANKGMATSAASAVERHLIETVNGSDTTQMIYIGALEGGEMELYGLGDGSLINPTPFVAPVNIHYRGKEYLVLDMRACTRWDRNEQQPVMDRQNQSLFLREKIRLIAEGLWVGLGPNEIFNIGNFQIMVYATWVSQMVARTFHLDIDQQTKVSVVAAFYYLCQFTEQIDPERATRVVMQSLKLGTVYAVEVTRQLEQLNTLEDFIAAVKTVVASDRLNGLTMDILVRMLTGSWFGANHAAITATALEYPPVWATLLYLSLTDRVNRQTGIAKIALQKERDNSAREFVRIFTQKLQAVSTTNT